MKSELNTQLLEKYAELCSRSLKGEPRTPFQMDKFNSVPTGWYGLVDNYLSILSNFPVVLLQVKEKFGGLRVYYAGEVSERARGILQSLEDASLKTCEICGGKAEPQSDNYWMRTRCEDHIESRRNDL